MRDGIYEVGGVSFNIREEKKGDIDIINEVFMDDVYRLREKSYTPEVIFDIGGHLGSFGVLAKTLWPNVRIIHVEPNNRSHELAKKNLERFGNVEFVCGAMKYDRFANVFMDDDRATGGGSMLSIDDYNMNFAGTTYYIHTENVTLYTIEDLMEMFNVSKIDIVKLDCECGERDFFNGLLPDTAEKIGDFTGEYHYERRDFIEDVKRVFPDYKLSFGGDYTHIGTFWGEKESG